MKKKRLIGIFIIANTLSGAEKRFIRIASELNRKRNDILLILNRELYELYKNDIEIKKIINVLEQNNKIRTFVYKAHKNRFLNTLLTFLKVYRIFKNNEISIIHSCLGGLKYSFVGRLLNIKTVGEITSPDIARKIYTTNLKYVIPYFDKMIAVSPGVKKRTKNSLMKIKKDIDIECLKIPFFLPTYDSSNFNKFDKKNLIVFASRFIDRKNPVLFAKAIVEFLNIRKNWDVAILGKGPLELRIKKILRNHIDNKKVIVEHTSDIYGYLKKSKIFVSLIYPDNYPSQSILEAMYMRNAILATNVGDTSKLVNQNNGFLIEDYEVDSIVKTLIEATSDGDRLNKMGEASFNKVVTEFSSKIYIEQLENIYEDLLNND